MSAPFYWNVRSNRPSTPWTALLARGIAVACIGGLAGLGFYEAWKNRDAWYFSLLLLAATLGPATMCTFGYFVCIPESLGHELRGETRGLADRWSEFTRLSAVVAVIIAWIGWTITLRETWNWSEDCWESAESLLQREQSYAHH